MTQLTSPEGLLSRDRDSYMASSLASEHYCDEVVDGAGRLLYLDKVGSVSALNEPSEPIWVDSLLDEQHRRFLHALQM